MKSLIRNKRIKELIQITGILVAYYMFLSFLHISCPIKWLTGVSCAGCGMSRAILTFLSGNIKGAFHYHPLFILMPFVLIIYLYRDKFSDKTLKILLGLLITVFMVCYIIRLFNVNDTIVVADINDSAIIKIIRRVIK